MALLWGCASSTCDVPPGLANRLTNLRKAIKPLERARTDFELYHDSDSDVIGREVRDIQSEVERLSQPEACAEVTDRKLTVLEQRLRAATDTVLGYCLDKSAQKRVELDRLGKHEKPAYPTELGQCLDRLTMLNERLADAQQEPARPCSTEPATLKDVRHVIANGDQGGLRRLMMQADRRLADLERGLNKLIESTSEPPLDERESFRKSLECAGTWILALGSREDVEQRYRKLHLRFENLDKHRKFFATCSSIVGEADNGRLKTLGREELEQRRRQVLSAFDEIQVPFEQETDLKATALGAIGRAEGARLRQLADAAIGSCDQRAFQSVLNDLKKLGSPAADLEDQFRANCSENVEGLAKRLQDDMKAFQTAMEGRNVAVQDHAMESLLATSAAVANLSTSGRRLLAQRVNLEAVATMQECAEALLKGDRAVEAGNPSVAASAYQQAAEIAGCRSGRYRKAQVDQLRARALIRKGDVERAWSLLRTTVPVLGAGAERELEELLREGVRSAPAGSSQKLTWFRRLRQQVGLDRLPEKELLELAALAADRAGNDPEVWREVWAALGAYFKNNPAVPSLDAFILASRTAHVLDVLGKGWMSGAWRNGGAPHIHRYLEWCQHYGRRLGAAMVLRLQNLAGYQEVVYLTQDSLEALWNEIQGLDATHRQRVRETALRRLLQAVSKTPLVRSAGIGAPGSDIGGTTRQLVDQAMARGLAVSSDGRLVASAAATPWGKLIVIFDSAAVTRSSGVGGNLKDRLAIARAKAMGTVAAILVELISGRTDLSVGQRRAGLAEIIQGLRYRMGYGILAYAGLFSRDGTLEVPRRPSEFFLNSDLTKMGVPVFQDPVSRKAASSSKVLVQRYDLKGRQMADVAVPIQRGTNRIGMLRLGVTQSSGAQR
ncbi:MAG: hypothetical protein GXP47_05205 [Acidobacteria bacterium]|nr:hypothetical protein [Acidobacteriota bacterium]